ncbi:MAG: hypothetical protein FJY73_06660 [Candidatus Eisenbacteria bacterium]|nr:hypothetical protein [Candidatus Eisenbacteria bacterium]
MTGRARVIWALAGAAVLAASAAGATLALALERGGPIRVEVREKRCRGDNVSLAIPSIAVAAVLPFLPNEVFHAMPEEAAQCARAARVFFDRLGDRPDFVLVDARGDEETVLVEKRGQALTVFVESGDALVFVSVPLWVMSRTARKAGGAQGAGV